MRTTMRPPPSAAVTAVAGPAALVAGILILRLYGISAAAPDYRVYRDAVSAAWAGVDVYRIDTSSPGSLGNPFTYPPFAALVLTPMTWVSWRLGSRLWALVSMLALSYVLASMVPRQHPRRAVVVGAAVAFSATTWVVVTNIGYGQVNLVLMAACALDLRRRPAGRGVPHGLLVGLTAATKVTPALFIVHFALTRQRRRLAWSIVGASAATAVAALVYPAMTATYFRSTLWGLTDRVDLGHSTGYWGNSSIYGAEVAAGLAGPVAALLVLALAAGLLDVARRVHLAGRELDAWLIVGLLAPMVSPYSWGHHYVYLLPALTRLAVTRRWARRRSCVALGLLLAVALNRGPELGEQWMHRGGLLLLLVGGLQREILVVTSLVAILALATPISTGLYSAFRSSVHDVDTTQLLKGVLDTAVLAVVADADGYGYDVLRRLRTAGLNEVGDASVYGTLRRLYAAGSLTSYVVPSDEGPHRKYYGITPAGRDQLARQGKDWTGFAETVTGLLNDTHNVTFEGARS